MIVILFIPKEKKDDMACDEKKEKSGSAFGRILSNFRACFHSSNQSLAPTVIALLLFQWVVRTTSYKNISTYFETKYGIESHQRGYMQSYQSALSFIVQSSMIKPILHFMGGELNAACTASFVMALAAFVEFNANFEQYLALVCPLLAIGIGIIGVSLKSTVSKVAPKSSLSSVFATIDVLQNVAAVTVPFYRTFLFRLTRPENWQQENHSTGDPDPSQWLIASGIHWILATCLFSYLLLWRSPCKALTLDEYAEKEKSL